MTGLLPAPSAPERASHFGDDHSVVLVAHRGPVRHSDSQGRLTAQRNAGGLVTALRDVVREAGNVRWICAPATEADRVVARESRWTAYATEQATCQVRMLDLDRAAHHRFYNVIANPLLWFVQHGLADQLAPQVDDRVQDAWEHGYVAVNRAFAGALANPADVPFGSTVMVHDYHFYLLPGMVRPARPDLLMHFFTHIPWPEPAAWRVLPANIRNAIFRGILGSDIVGFHTRGYAENLLTGCAALLHLPVDFRHGSVSFQGREVAVRHYPISIDTDALARLATSPAVAQKRAELLRDRAEKLVVRVDRADPSKNIVRGFRAFERCLELHPELCGRVSFFAQLQPTRSEVPEYARYMAEIRATVAAVNARFSTARWQPIDLRVVEDLPLAVAAYGVFDVLMVNSVADGMNLVAKEGVVVNASDGVLALSERAGAHDELGAVAVTLDPFDVEQQARALYDALVMPAAERRERRAIGAEIVRANDMQKWLDQQLMDIELLRAAQGQVTRA